MADVFDVKGLDGLHDKLVRLGPSLGRSVLLTALRQGAKPIIESAKAKAPFRTGRLRDSIKVKAGKKRGTAPNAAIVEIGPTVRYGHLVEFATPARVITVKKKRVLASGGEVFGRSVNHPGTAARPFLRPAFEEQKFKALNTIGEALWKRLEKIAKT